MSKGRCLGLLGGLGVGATVHYYQALAQAHDARNRTLDIVITHSQTARVFEYVQAHAPIDLAEYLNTFLRRLQAAGAEFAVLPAVTAQYAWRELVATSPLPLISMIDPLAAALAARNARRVAIFGTRYSVQSGFFGLLSNIEFVQPTSAEVDLIDTIYRELLRDRRGTESQHAQLTTLAQTLCARDAVDAILIAGTDLSLLFNQANTPFPHIDCAAVHLDAIVHTLLD